MPVRAVVGHHVDDDANTGRVCLGDQGRGVGKGSEERIDIAIVGHVVARVRLRRHVPRIQPNRVDTEVAQVTEVGSDAVDVTDPVAARVGEAADVHLVDGGAAPPCGAAGIRRRPWVRVAHDHPSILRSPERSAIAPHGARSTRCVSSVSRSDFPRDSSKRVRPYSQLVYVAVQKPPTASECGVTQCRKRLLANASGR
jgi:hypothetical protein